MHKSKRAKVAGRGPAGKAVVIGVKDRATNRVRARVIDRKDAATLKGFVESHRKRGAKVYTDDFPSYRGSENHEIVKHSVKEFVNGQAHTNGMESCWGMLKRGYHGVYTIT